MRKKELISISESCNEVQSTIESIKNMINAELKTHNDWKYSSKKDPR